MLRIKTMVLSGLVLATVLAARPVPAAPTGFVEMSDGTLIAISVHFPEGYVAGEKLPTIFEMSGYDGGSAKGQTLMGDYCAPAFGSSCPLTGDSRGPTFMYTDPGRYVVVHASVRGTGCSSGEFDLFSSRSALDGREIIDGWIPKQPWFNGKIGITGHSYSGLTGFLVAATQPRELDAMSVSGLIDDLYRGITYPGGVTNYGFPLLWTGGVRPLYDVGGGTAPGLVRPAPVDDDHAPEIREQCAKNAAAHRRTVLNDPIVQGVGDTDSDWWRARSLISFVDRIQVPTMINGAYQDEQTGPRGPAHLFEKLRVPKRLLLTNGDHGTASSDKAAPEQVWQDRLAWMDHHLHGDDSRARALGYDPAAASSVRILLEMHQHSIHGTGGWHANHVIDREAFPLEDTEWTTLFLRGDGRIDPAPPSAAEGELTYVSGSKRQSWSYQAGPSGGREFTTPDGSDEVTYRGEVVTEPTVIVGPITATLWMRSTAPDTELFVQIAEERVVDGRAVERTYLQRGMLRASHRAIDPLLSDHAPNGEIYRPFRPHTSAVEIIPGDAYEYLVEVFPVGHVIRPGHRLVVKVHAPPVVDSYYAYVPKSAPAINSILHGPDHPSRLMLPIVAVDEDLGPEVGCGQQDSVRCVRL